MLTDAQRSALALADVVMSEPAHLPSELRDRLRRHFSDDQLVELVLDILKWSYQKVPVALGLDVEVRPGELTPLVFDDDGRWVRPA